MKRFSMALGALLLAVAASADYRIELKGGGALWSAAHPVLKGGFYTFSGNDGTLLSVRAADVVSVSEGTPAKKEGSVEELGALSGTRTKKTAGNRLRGGRFAAPSDLEKRDAYQPGRGMAVPSASDQFQVGRSLAPPPSGQVTTGPPPNIDDSHR